MWLPALVACALHGAAAAQQAAIANTTVVVSATLVRPCTLAVGSLAFPAQMADQPASTPADGVLTVDCPAKAPYLVTLDAGRHASRAGGQRAVASGEAAIPYELYQDPGRTRVWGDAGFANEYPAGQPLSRLATGGGESLPVYAVLHFAGAPEGDYFDMVTVTLHL